MRVRRRRSASYDQPPSLLITEWAHTSVMPREAKRRTICSGSFPSGEPSSNPEDILQSERNILSKGGERTITVLANAMRWCIRNQHHHLASLGSPV